MRIPKYLSNTSISLFYSDRMEFYLKYLAKDRPPRIPQTRPMSVGSAFDAYVKSYLVEKLLGVGVKSEFALDAIFTKQVEKHNRDWALEAGRYTFECYKRSGALADLMLELSLAKMEPRFEFTVSRIINDIPLLGKPDVWFVTKHDVHMIMDWKVNGYCSRSAVSPRKGYVSVADGWDHKKMPPSRNHRACHRDAQLLSIGGIICNVAVFLEDVDQKWADQTSLYGWLMGEEIGSRFITGIDQIVAKPGNPPILRIARHRCIVSAIYQKQLWDNIVNCWDTIQSGHIFDDLSREASDARCQVLDDYYKAYDGDDPKEKWFQEITRTHKGY